MFVLIIFCAFCFAVLYAYCEWPVVKQEIVVVGEWMSEVDGRIWTFLALGLLSFLFIFVYKYSDGNFKEGGGGWYSLAGPIGDFIGGIANPFVALLALFWLVRGVKIQQIELKEARGMLKLSEMHQDNQVKISAISALISAKNDEIKIAEDHLDYLILESEKSEPDLDDPVDSLRKAFSVDEEITAVLQNIGNLKNEKLRYVGALKIIAGPLPSME